MKVSPSEIIYWQILPAIRRELVIKIKEEGLKQKEIARLFNLTPSAISQYLKSKRGEYEFSKSFQKEIKISAKRIILEESTAFIETNQLIKKFENSKGVCSLCHDKNHTKKNCGICFE